MSTSVRRSGSGSAIAAAMAFCCSDPALRVLEGVLDGSACCNRVSGICSKSEKSVASGGADVLRIARTKSHTSARGPARSRSQQGMPLEQQALENDHGRARAPHNGGRRATLVGCITPGRPPRAQRGRLCTQGATAGRACKGADGRQTPRGCTLRSFQRQRRAAQTQRHSLGAAPAAPRAAVRRTSY